MQALHDLKDEDLQGLAPEAIAALAQQMLQRLRQQDNEIRFKDAKIEKITFQLSTAEGMEVRRQDRGDERRAAPSLRGDAGRG